MESVRFASVSITCAAAGDYAANDVLSNSATGDAGVANVLELARLGDIAKILQITAKCNEDSVLFRTALDFYDTNPAAADVEMDDNATVDFAKTSTGAAAWMGRIVLPAFADKGTSLAAADGDLLDKLIRAKVDNHKVYFVASTLDAEANETAGMILTFEFYFA